LPDAGFWIERGLGREKIYVPNPQFLDADISVAFYDTTSDRNSMLTQCNRVQELQEMVRSNEKQPPPMPSGLFNPSSLTDEMVQSLEGLFGSLGGCLTGLPTPQTVPGLLWAVFRVLCEAILSVSSEEAREQQRAKLRKMSKDLAIATLDEMEYLYDRARILRDKLNSNAPLSLMKDIRDDFLKENPSTWAYLVSLLLFHAIPGQERWKCKSKTVQKSFWLFRFYCAVEKTWANWQDVVIEREGAAPNWHGKPRVARSSRVDLEAVAASEAQLKQHLAEIDAADSDSEYD
jgi:hypothetical protein